MSPESHGKTASLRIGDQVIFRENERHERVLGIVTRVWTNDRYVTVLSDGRTFTRLVEHVTPTKNDAYPTTDGGSDD